MLGARADLASLYASAASPDTKLATKAARLAQLTSDYQALKAHWGGYTGYDRWFGSGVNNAQLASIAVYTAFIPAFRALLQHENGDLPHFYARVRRLAAGSPAEREHALQLALTAPGTVPPAGQPATSAAGTGSRPVRH